MNAPVTTEVLSGEARFILQHLSQNLADGNPNHMSEVRSALEEAVTLEFADYLKFLKKFRYITLNRQTHTLGLTEEGERVAGGQDVERFALEVSEYFQHRIDDPVPPKVIVEDPPRGGETRVAPLSSGESGYVRYDELGSGAVGRVLRGRHGHLGIDVAIKEIKDLFGYFSFLKRETVAARLGEAVRAQAALTHPAIVRIFDLETDVAHPYFVMELCEGGSLRGLIEAHPDGLPYPEALRLFAQILYGLRAAHAAGVLHLGLKPENVLLDALGNVRLSDFGMRRLIEPDGDASSGAPQVFLGTGGMAYLAPEQMETSAEVDARADLYAAGILLYELVVGRVPGRRAPMPSEARPKVPKKLDDLFDRLTQDRPEDRAPDADAVLEAFHAAFEGLGAPGDLLLRGRPTPAGPSPDETPSAKTDEADGKGASQAKGTGAKAASTQDSKDSGDGTASKSSGKRQKRKGSANDSASGA